MRQSLVERVRVDGMQGREHVVRADEVRGCAWQKPLDRRPAHVGPLQDPQLGVAQQDPQLHGRLRLRQHRQRRRTQRLIRGLSAVALQHRQELVQQIGVQRHTLRGGPRRQLGQEPVWIQQRKHSYVVRATHDAANELECVRRRCMAQAGHIRIVRAAELRHVLIGARQHMVLPHERHAKRLVVRLLQACARHLHEARGLCIRLVGIQPTSIVKQVRSESGLSRGRCVLDARERLDARV